MHWLRLYSEARTDNKLRALSDAQHRVWFNLLCYAGEQPRRGIIESDAFMLSIECAGGDEELLNATLTLLARLRIVAVEDGAVRFLAWDDRQYDKPSDRPEETAERKRKSRANANHSITPEANAATPEGNSDGDVTPMSRSVTPRHDPYTETETETDKIQSRAEAETETETGAGGAGASVAVHPFALLEALCDAIGQDTSVLAKRERDRQLAVAKRLVADGFTPPDIDRMVGWLSAQSWVTGGVDLFLIEKQSGKWRLAGSPATVTPRATNGANRQAQTMDNVQRFLAQAGGTT